MLKIDVEQNAGMEITNSQQCVKCKIKCANILQLTKESVLVNDWFDIFICIIHNVFLAIILIQMLLSHFISHFTHYPFALLYFSVSWSVLHLWTLMHPTAANYRCQGCQSQGQGCTVQRKSKSLCRCSGNLCTLYQRMSLTDTTISNVIVHKIKNWCCK